MKLTPTLRRVTVRFVAVAAVITAAFGVQGAMTAAPSAPSSVVTIDPSRILDTRAPIGVLLPGPVEANSSITISVAGVGGVPADATGVIMTLTATDATAATFITATPTGTARSATSVLNPGPGSAIANTVTMSLGTDGKVDLYNLAGTVHLVADVTGYLVDAAPSVRTKSIELSAYGGMGANIGLPYDFGCVDLANDGMLFIDVPLPHGATVAQVAFRWFDDDASGEVTMYITEVNNTGPSGTPTQGNMTGNTAQSAGSAGYGTSTVTVGGADPVSSTVRYHIVASTLGQGNVAALHRFCGATVTYRQLTT